MRHVTDILESTQSTGSIINTRQDSVCGHGSGQDLSKLCKDDYSDESTVAAMPSASCGADSCVAQKRD